MFLLDVTSEYGARVERHLREDFIIWIVHTRENGQPEPSPVWFLWNGESFLVYSEPLMPKVRNIRQRSRVSLHLNSTEDGRDIVVITGEAALAYDVPPVINNPPYLYKYTRGILALGTTPEEFSAAYSVPIRITPTQLRGF